MHQSSIDKMLVFRKKYLGKMRNNPLQILDLGSNDINGTYKEYFDIFPWTYRGIDITSGENVDIELKNPYHWHNVKSNSADVLISGQAFEHIEFFWLTMIEIARVLRPGGLCCIIAPSGGPEHRYPVDCWRFYPDGFSALAKFVRLEVMESHTQWEPDSRYNEKSNVWRDTVLVCKKASFSKLGAWRYRIWLGLRRGFIFGL